MEAVVRILSLFTQKLLDFHADRRFDAVVGRYVLMFQPDPVAAIVHAARQVRPEGIIVFQYRNNAPTRVSYLWAYL
jgi:2-polyprenyl-3-methyl-5-hydroxy-6-metoxy-1,4-benzoquinol methylase